MSDLLRRSTKLSVQPRIKAGIRNDIGLIWATNYATDTIPGAGGAILDSVTGRMAFSQDSSNYISGLDATAGGLAGKYNIGSNVASVNYVLPGIAPYAYQRCREFTLLLSIVFDGSASSAQYVNFRISYELTLDIFSRTATSLTFGSDWAGTWNGASQQTMTGLKTGDVVTIVVSVNQAGARFFCNGKYTGSKSAGLSSWYLSSGTAMQMAQGGYDKRLCQAMFDRAIPDDLARSLSENPWQIFKDQNRQTFPAASVSLQLLSPASDITAGAWSPSTGTTLYGVIDESAASDTDYIYASSASYSEVKLQAGNDPVSSTGHVLNYRLMAGTGDVLVALKQGAATIASWSHTLTGSAQDISQTLTGTQADSITDYTDLRVGFTSS